MACLCDRLVVVVMLTMILDSSRALSVARSDRKEKKREIDTCEYASTCVEISSSSSASAST